MKKKTPGLSYLKEGQNGSKAAKEGKTRERRGGEEEGK